ncbi:SusC/RagA family TonB-linked outer membrane protein [Sphingobacterium thalpophilum]|uniref:Outer membrane receptor for ferrienterochelin and colicins n=1 Tax=Sphingobacterium thalpophilum TaxID=259 RepID=A0A4U9UNW3_9SPHI|nr:SusC/RagA family TonB-linked outer membrane protein [Sphingobacterium thalpophilum]VTR34743.1 Outer membrane receptor for ferrienterochelin and colicins [Sphingobacterium thalpophilum]
MRQFFGAGEVLPSRKTMKLYSTLLSILWFSMFSLSAQTPRKDSGAGGPMDFILQGIVVSASDGKPLQGVSVRVDAENLRTSCKKDGTFNLSVQHRKGKVRFTCLGFKPLDTGYVTGVPLTIKLLPLENQLEEVEVVSTGYQKIPKERATGSFEFVDSKLLNRKVSMDFLSRLEDVVTSISATKVYGENRGVLPNINIRGRSSIRSNIWPLIVVDGFPYNGDFNNINPNDIENVTILKDAAASSIWGAQSGNGIIVVTTKKGKFNSRFSVAVNSNLTVENKPDLYYLPQMNSSDFIDVELMLNEKGYYKNRMDNRSFIMSPVVKLLKRFRDGKITGDQLEASIDQLRNVDMRDDFLKYVYRNPIRQQYNVQLSGGGNLLSTIFSFGYDRQLNRLVTSSADRVSIKNNTVFRPTSKLEFTLGTQYTEYGTKDSYMPVAYNEMGLGYGNYPYMRLADYNGTALIVDAIGLNADFRDTIGGGRLLDWNYRPLDELHQSTMKGSTKETMLSFSSSYALSPQLKFSVLYNYRTSAKQDEYWRGIGTVQQRTEINYFTSWDKEGIRWNMPVGDFLQTFIQRSASHQGRVQAMYHKAFNSQHELSLLAGAEVRQQVDEVNTSTFYGYDPETMSYQPVDLVTYHPYLNGMSGTKRIPDYNQKGRLTNRYTSFFVNGSYTILGRYVLSASARKDASNLFGVRTNDKGQPFWSVGAAWTVSGEPFFPKEVLDFLKFRMTHGYNGNVNNSTSALPVIYKSMQTHYLTGLPYAYMLNPPNPMLRWETVGMWNWGLDFRALNDRLGGSLEYYIKSPKDLIAETRIDLTTGFSTSNVNSANLKGKGIDLTLYAINMKTKNFEWRTDANLAYSRTKVTKSFIAEPLGKYYLSGAFGNIVTPVEGGDLYGLISYKWAGLDPVDGSPQGYVNGEISKDYFAIVNDTRLDQMDNLGSVLPLYFGSIRNSFRYKKFDLSFNISLQLGHKFMRKSIDYSALITGFVGHSDYALRWQNPGDELRTNVPAFNYPANYNADYFYNYSSALVASADQIKWRDLQLGFNPIVKGLQDCRIYLYCNNIMKIWRANKYGIDPEFGNNPPDPFACSLGLSFKF